MLALTDGITEKHLAELYADEYIQRVGYDDRPASPVSHPLASYVSAFVNNVFAGAFLIIRFSRREIEIHSLLYKWALSYSRKLGEMILDLVFSKKDVLRVTANILGNLKSARNYCLKLGFQLEGIKRSVCLIKGKPTDLYILGLLRQDWRKK
jgi:RimJ/RimL family protein N-acetyltransferase